MKYLILLLVGVGAGIVFYKAYLLKPCEEPSEIIITSVEEQQVVIPDTATVQEISSALKSVCKLIHTEKTYNLVVRYKITYTVPVIGEVSSLGSRVVVNATAKVGIGIDYSKVELDFDQANKIVNVLYMPDSEVMYSDISYKFAGSDNVVNRVGIKNFAGISLQAQKQTRDYINRDASMIAFEENAEKRIISDLMLIAGLGNWKFSN